MIERLRQEVDAGFPSLAGARVSGSIPVSQAVVNDWLRRLPQVPSGLILDFQSANRIVARYGVVQATAVLDDVVQLGQGAPRVGLELASTVLAWVIGQTLRVPGVRISGRRVTIDLGALPGQQADGRYWSYVRAARLRTTPGQIHVEFDLAVT